MDFDKAYFTEQVANNPNLNEATRNAIFDLLDFARRRAYKVTSGGGDTNFHYVVGTRTGSAYLFYVDADGGIDVALANFPTLSPANVSRLVRRLAALSTGFDELLRFEDKRVKGGTHSAWIKNTVVDPFVMSGFKAAVLKLQSEIEGR